MLTSQRHSYWLLFYLFYLHIKKQDNVNQVDEDKLVGYILRTRVETKNKTPRH